MLRAYFIIALLFSALAAAVLLGTVHATSVPEFTLKYVDYSYDVPPKTTTTTDPYTNETITTTTPGYHVENKTIQATINNNISASYYNFRYKGHYTNKWNYYPFNPDSFRGYNLYSAYNAPTYVAASDSDYTVILIYLTYLPESIPEGGVVDVQMQALFGGYRQGEVQSVFTPGGATYNFYFEGTTSDWSNTQAITIGESQTPTPSPLTTPTPTPYQEPQQTEQEIIIGAAITVVVIGAGLGLLVYLIKRK
jgi:hypothetical protein